MDKFPKTFPVFEVEATPTGPSELGDGESTTSISPTGELQEQTNPSFGSAVFWMLVNTFATVGIVR